MRLFAIIFCLFCFSGCAVRSGGNARAQWLGESGERRFTVVEVLDGTWRGREIALTRNGVGNTIPVRAVDVYTGTIVEGARSEGIHMVLAFQLEEGKTREDFRAFKSVDLSWVTGNNGVNHATVWTTRTAQWPFDAFDEITFATMEDFRTAYAGNEGIAQAAEGLFTSRVFVAIVGEQGRLTWSAN